MNIITVTQANKYISSILKSDRNLQSVMIRGEISNYVHHKSGHRYFSLKDNETSIKAVMFAFNAGRLNFEPHNGMSVIVSGKISVFERDGVYQLYADNITPDGIGQESVALDMLKRKLASQGIFAEEHKLKIPSMPEKVGVVTSHTGAALQDIINVISRRYPLCELFAVNATVQGENAPESICRGIAKAESLGCDVIIIGRGGGSSEDLGAFNNEAVAMAIYNCRVPVISAVGHQIDYTVADLVADARAATPSVAAEIAVPNIQEIKQYIYNLERRSENAMSGIINRKENQFLSLDTRLTANSPENRLKLAETNLDNLNKRIANAIKRQIEKAESDLAAETGRLENLSPLKVMSRGYSLAYKNDVLLRDSEKLSEGDVITLRFDKGGAEAIIKKKW